ncbi:hypothetical protein ACH4S8_34565 [Streptomyces sp. NPDC021080]|uniref:hypothetical protein n=1 Tax=Streptomyces sp. NPDC021080 TaxID=3365110 RepID=UPI0037AD607F
MAEPERGLNRLSVLGVFIVLAAGLERCLSLLNGPKSYPLCSDPVELTEELHREASVNRWLLLAGLVLAVAALIVSFGRRGRVLPVLTLAAVLTLVVLADGYAARADAVAARIMASQTCDEPGTLYETSRGWFDWSPLGP